MSKPKIVVYGPETDTVIKSQLPGLYRMYLKNSFADLRANSELQNPEQIKIITNGDLIFVVTQFLSEVVVSNLSASRWKNGGPLVVNRLISGVSQPIHPQHTEVLNLMQYGFPSEFEFLSEELITDPKVCGSVKKETHALIFDTLLQNQAFIHALASFGESNDCNAEELISGLNKFEY